MSIKFENVSHVYNPGTPISKRVLQDISSTISLSTFTCIVGHTGSGKSTFMQHLNALLLPVTGSVEVPGGIIKAGVRLKREEVKSIRKNIGLVFQFPEYQLFETTVLKDIMFGPKNYNKNAEEAKKAALIAAKLVGLDKDLLEKSPFELSGGQMRRVAIAGILAMNPEVIVLDEPTAGLDPKGQKEILEILLNLKSQGKTIIVATHDMDLVAKYADKVIVLKEGELLIEGTPSEVFSKKDLIKQAGIYLPTATEIFTRSFPNSKAMPLCLESFIDSVLSELTI